jgi:mono/diheme cytochrome c family protein
MRITPGILARPTAFAAASTRRSAVLQSGAILADPVAREVRMCRSRWSVAGRIALGVSLVLVATTVAAQEAATPTRSGREIYESICATCHGPDGKGDVNPDLVKVAPPPDFTDCAFANREPDEAFLAVAHGGGPARGFSPLMPAWGGAFSEQELRLAISHMRTFCTDQRWARGELNLPLALVTGKAFPEDEAVVRVTSQSGSVVTRFVYERRIGALNQWEVAVPVASVEQAAGGRSTGLGDIALGYKRVLSHSLDRGNIFSASAEVKLPSGSDSKGRGNGFAVFEPFLTFGQILPGDGFLQAQAGFEVPFESGHDADAFWRAAVGRSVARGRFGRLWSPMVELLGARTLASGHRIEWDVLPAVQVTLNTRQHIRVAGGVRLPVTDADARKKSVLVYLLWDWYEGGFFQGW